MLSTPDGVGDGVFFTTTMGVLVGATKVGTAVGGGKDGLRVGEAIGSSVGSGSDVGFGLLPPPLLSSVGYGSGVDPPSGTGVRVGIVIWPEAVCGRDKDAIVRSKERTQTIANKALPLNIIDFP